MEMLFGHFSIWQNLIAFAVAAGAVWIAGTKLAGYADAIGRLTGAGQAMVGMLLLGGITSLPEIAVAGSAAISGNAALAVNNLLGGFTMQVAILAFADVAIRNSTITTAAPDPAILLQGTLGIVLVALTVVGISVGDVSFLGAGLWTWGIFGVFLYSIRIVSMAGRHPSWRVVMPFPESELEQAKPDDERSGRRLALLTFAAAATIFVSGFVLSQSAEALAEQTGLGSSFFAAVFVAISTSLPEISTVIAAFRLRRYVMAVSDIFGTNLFDIALIFLVDLMYQGPTVLNEAGSFSIVAAMLGIVVTGVFLVGLIERRDPLVFGIGLDSFVVAGTYLGGIGLLYTLR